jgi:hypothetical protein
LWWIFYIYERHSRRVAETGMAQKSAYQYIITHFDPESKGKTTQKCNLFSVCNGVYRVVWDGGGARSVWQRRLGVAKVFVVTFLPEVLTSPRKHDKIKHWIINGKGEIR